MAKVSTSLNYSFEGAPGYFPGTAGYLRRQFDVQSVHLLDLRPQIADLSVDREGFQLIQQASEVKDFDNEETIKAVYFSEVADIIKRATGASQVLPFQHLVRRDRFETAMEASSHLGDLDAVDGVVPARFVHVDQSYTGAETLMRHFHPDANRVSKSRWAVMNLWRPIGGPVRRDPLAVCDARSVHEDDLLPVNVSQGPSVGGGYQTAMRKAAQFQLETWHLLANPKHQWYYVSEMQPEEALLFKIFDSKRDGRARRTPHTACKLSTDSGPPRESIEVRCFVSWEDESVE